MTRTTPDAACVFCLAPDDDEGRALIVHDAPLGFVILNLFPYNSGHLMVVPRRHVATLADLTDEELGALARLTRLSEQALTAVYQPQGVNVGMNLGRPAGAGVADHLHVHLVPRWTGDTNFMTVVGEVRVLPEALADSAARLRPTFSRLAGVDGTR
ncbi:MAG: HIT domain-containing protein [Acidobacteriota bacterium]